MQPWAESKQSAAILLEDGSFIIYAWSAKALLKFHDLSHVIGVGCFNIIKCVMPRVPICSLFYQRHVVVVPALFG